MKTIMYKLIRLPNFLLKVIFWGLKLYATIEYVHLFVCLQIQLTGWALICLFSHMYNQP